MSEVPGLQDTYYRFALIKEVYRNVSDALSRMANLKAPPRATTKHEKLCYMRRGFRKHKTVFIVVTDVARFWDEKMPYIFNHFKEHVEREID